MHTPERIVPVTVRLTGDIVDETKPGLFTPGLATQWIEPAVAGLLGQIQWLYTDLEKYMLSVTGATISGIDGSAFIIDLHGLIEEQDIPTVIQTWERQQLPKPISDKFKNFFLQQDTKFYRWTPRK